MTKNHWLLFIGLAIGPLMVGIDLLVMGVAIEPMTQALSIDIATLQWFLTAYGIGNSSFLVTAGRLADLYGKKTILMWGLLLFGISSGAIAFSSSPHFIIVARLIQGASGGILPVIGVASLMAIYPPDKRTGWISGLVGIAGLGMVLGPAVGGIIIHYFSWRLIFLINLPIALLGILLLAFFFPKLPSTPSKGEKVDWLGVITLTATLILFTVAVSNGHLWGWDSFKTIAFFTSFVILLLIFLLIEKKVSQPLMDFELFRAKNFLPAGIAGFVIYFSLTAWILVFGIYLERVKGMNPQEAGIAFLPFGLMLALLSTQMQKLTQRFGAKKLIVWGLLLCVIAFIGMALLPLVPKYYLLGIYFALFGLGFIFDNSNSLPAALEYLPIKKGGIASGTSFMFRWLGGALGAAIISSIFTSHAIIKMKKLVQSDSTLAPNIDLLRKVLTGEESQEKFRQFFKGSSLTQAQQVIDRAFHHGLVISMATLAGILFLALLINQIFLEEKK